MLNQYFTDDRIINQLCKERIKLANQRHDRQYIHRLAGHLTETPPNHPFYQLLPPRRQWADFRPQSRSASSNPDLYALKRGVRVLRYHQPNLPWVVELNHYIAAIQARVFHGQDFTITLPRINFIPKKIGGHEYRALARFDPDDNLILCLFANYLRDKFDSLFSSSSFAFRAVRNGHVPTHHDAFNQLCQLKHNSGNCNLHVAECDIKGFFDTVDHGVALDAFEAASARVNLDPRAATIFRAYLDCYSFPANVLNLVEPGLKRRDPKGYCKWPEAELRKIRRVDPRSLRIGVAQGGAVSGIIANLIMDRADKCVEAEATRLGAEIHYYRYCDDMLLISPKQRHCKKVFAAYLKKLTELKLAFHLPEKTCIYGRDHWGHKSKAPYNWSGELWFRSVPWVQFVGYQIRYDGLVRPRKDSIAKQCRKLVETTDKLKFGLSDAGQVNPIRASPRQALASLQSKLAAQGVGRIEGGEVGPKPICWAAGYRALHEKPFIGQALRSFDRVRRKQINRFARIGLNFGSGLVRRQVHRRNPVGYAFSYHGQFRNEGGQSLITNPWRPANLKDKCKVWLFQQWKRWFFKRN